MKPDQPPKRADENIKKPFENIKPKESLKDFPIVHFKNKTLVSSPDGNILVLDNNEKEIQYQLNQYGLASSVRYEGDPDGILVDIEKKLYLLGHPITEKDFIYIKDFKREDLELFNKVFGVKQFDFSLNTWEVDFDEVLVFLRYTKNSDQNEFDRILKYKEKYGIKPFLSLVHGGKEMGNKILTLEEKLPENTARAIFSKYGEIVDAADKAEQEVKNLYSKENISNEVFESIKETLLKRGVSLLSNLADDIKENTAINEQEILNKLEDIKTQTIIMGSSYVELYKQGLKIPIEEISNTSLEKISAQDLTEKEKQELLKVYENGRPTETYENKEHIKLLKDEFEQTLNNKDTFIFNVRFNNEIVAFATFNKENQDTLHIGGLTFIEDIRNPAIAVAVLNAVMNEFKNFNIKALVHSKNKILPMYQKRFGFKITGELPLGENAGELYYEIERPKNEKLSEGLDEKKELKKAA